MSRPESKKLVIVGDGACGKTCLLAVFDTGRFPEDYVPTVFENTITDTTVDGVPVELALWDTAGQEDYDRLRPLSYPDTDVLLVTFDISNTDSLENVEEKWGPEVEHYCPDTPVVLVGTKVDIRGEDARGCVTNAQGKAVAKAIGAVDYVECSAMHNRGVREVFESAVRACLTTEKPPEWDCRHLTKEHAMARLSAKDPGTFVIRASGGAAAATMSLVQPGGDHFQIRIYYDEGGGGYRLNKAREFHKDLNSLIKYHQYELGPLPCVLLGDEPLETPEWNCIGLTKAEAEVKLVCNPFGSFIIRKATSGFAVLAYVSKSGLRRLEIEERDSEETDATVIAIKGSVKDFPDLNSLARFYMKGGNPDIPIKLTSPVSSDGAEEGAYGSLADSDSEL